MKKLKVLRILNSVEETTAPFNQFSLPLADEQEITICSYYKPGVYVPPQIKCIAEDGSAIGFFRALKKAFLYTEYDVIHVHYPPVGFLFFLYHVAMHKNLKVKAIFTIHTSYSNFKWRDRILLVPIFAFFQKIVYCGKSSQESFPYFFRRLSGSRSAVIQNGVDIRRIDHAVEGRGKSFDLNNFTIVAVGRLISLKNPNVIVEAFKECCGEQDKLIFIGEGDLRASIALKAAQLGLKQNIEITGRISREEVYKYLFNADLFISASRIEGLPVSVLEAMACSCPVILSDIPSHREVTQGSDFIPLVACADSKGLAKQIRRFKYMSPSEREDLSERCKKIAKSNFSLDSMLKKYIQIYEER